MRKFIERALNKLSKLDTDQIRALLFDLATENERLEVVLDSMNDGVLVADTDHKIVLYNKAAERLVPLTTTDVYERPLADAIDDDEIAEFVRETLAQQHSVLDREFTLEENGSARILSCSVFPLVRAGRIQGNILHVEEITEKRGREARLRRAENLASLTTLAAGVAHEIKNPLGSIGIHMQLIQKALDSNGTVDSDKISEFVEIVNEEVERLNRIVVDFLFAVRPMDMSPRDEDLSRVVADVLTFVRYECEQAGVEIKQNLDEELPTLQIDEKYIKQALMNMVKNAISAMPDGGDLTVSTYLNGDDVCLRVADTGVGIEDDVIDKIFEPYFTTKEFGSGIGLTLVYKIVKEHNGEISVLSHPGKGTTFTITFPVPQREQHLISWEAG